MSGRRGISCLSGISKSIANNQNLLVIQFRCYKQFCRGNKGCVREKNPSKNQNPVGMRRQYMWPIGNTGSNR